MTPARSLSRQNRLKRAAEYLRDRYFSRKGVPLSTSVDLARDFENEIRRWNNRDRPSWVRTTADTTCEEILEEALRQNLRLAALDTEYFMQKPGGPVITEVGFSMLCPVTTEVKTHHYVTNGGKGSNQKKFLYGASQYYGCTDMLRDQLLYHLSEVDCVLFWGKENDLRALQSMGVYVPAGKVVDAVGWQQRANWTGNGECYYSLGEFCEIQGVDHKAAHNAGNDSHALLTAVLHGLGVLGDTLEMTEITRCA